MLLGFNRAKILSYDPSSRTAKVHIFGLTDGVSEGLTATFAYAIGEDDRDTEIKILGNSSNLPEVYVFFDGGDEARPVIAFFSSHGSDNVKDVRRIRQSNIEILATTKVTITAPTLILNADVEINGKITHQGDMTSSGTITVKKDVVADGISLVEHPHKGVKAGTENSGPPVAT
ncbi:hypothetical protein [Acinetobacter sp. MB5]|uniref:hypothetical protein n=1 Tax=Acinetobacter sp. MB5 TaxID=2069438 RepID=UPI000DCFB915|nr:hypothetical protein [Acinetobacter sp. MB5]